MPDAPTALKVTELVEDSLASDGTGGLILKRVFRVDGITLSSANGTLDNAATRLQMALTAPGIPGRGDKIRMTDGQADDPVILGDTYCHDIQARQVHNQKTSAIVTADYQEIGKVCFDSKGGEIPNMWLVGAKVNGSTVNIQSSFDNAGNLIKVVYDSRVGPHPYDPTSATSADIAAGLVLVEYAKIPKLEALGVVQFNMREINDLGNGSDYMQSVIAKQRQFNDSVNSQDYMGYPKGTLRLRMMVGDFDAVRSQRITDPRGYQEFAIVWDTQYVFDHRKRGWQEVSVMMNPWTGFPPPDMENPGPVIVANSASNATVRTGGNGWVISQGYAENDFTELNLPNLADSDPGANPLEPTAP